MLKKQIQIFLIKKQHSECFADQSSKYQSVSIAAALFCAKNGTRNFNQIFDNAYKILF